MKIMILILMCSVLFACSHSVPTGIDDLNSDWQKYDLGGNDYIWDIAFEGNYVWCATNFGFAVRFDKRDGSFEKYNLAERTGISNIIARSVIVDSKNVKWFGTNHGAFTFDGKSWKKVEYLADNYISSMAVDSKNVLWLATYRGVFSYNGTKWEFHTTDNFSDYSFIRSIAVDQNDVKWFGMYDGIASLNGTEWKIDRTIDDFTNHTDVFIAVDKNNVKWFTSYGCVYSFNGLNWKKYGENVGFKTYVTSVAVDANNVKWFGTFKQIMSFDGKSWQTYDIPDLDYNAFIASIDFDENGLSWLGTFSLINFRLF